MENSGSFSKTITEELEKFGKISFVPSGDSMWPTIKGKRQSVIVCKKEGRLSPYSIGLFIRPDGRVVLHRVLEVSDNGYVFCGDSQFNKERVPSDRVIGVAIGYYRGKNYIPADENEKDRAKKWFSDDKKRKRKVNAYFFRKKWKTRFIKLIKLEYFKGKKNV